MGDARLSACSARQSLTLGARNVIAALLMVLLVCLLPGCGGKSVDGGYQVSKPLSRVSVPDGSRVYVNVSGGSRGANEDLASLITATLQSERALSPAYSKSEADVTINVDVRNVYMAGTESGSVSGSQALGNSAMGGMLGLAIGSAASQHSGTGALIGAAIGIAAGLGATAIDARGHEVWAMDADVTIAPRGDRPDPESITIRTSGKGLGRDKAEGALTDSLSRVIAEAVVIRSR